MANQATFHPKEPSAELVELVHRNWLTLARLQELEERLTAIRRDTSALAAELEEPARHETPAASPDRAD